MDSRRPDMKKKLVVVGDDLSPHVYAENRFPESYIPTVFENYVTQIQVRQQIGRASTLGHRGQEEYDRLRPLSYPESDETPLILVWNQDDLRRCQVPVTPEQGGTYVECSVEDGEWWQDVFNLALRESMKGRWGRLVTQRRCVIV
ncbi:signal transducer [Suillus occidentalis]|nr:signal transducer [Suillus occidentalis]